MATSETTSFNLSVDELIEEAYERCGLELRTGYDLETARRSLNIMIAEWANRGLNQWLIVEQSFTVTKGTNEYSLGTDVVDITSAVMTRDNTDFQMSSLFNTPQNDVSKEMLENRIQLSSGRIADFLLGIK